MLLVLKILWEECPEGEPDTPCLLWGLGLSTGGRICLQGDVLLKCFSEQVAHNVSISF